MKLKAPLVLLFVFFLGACSSLEAISDSLRRFNPFGDKIVFQLPPKSNQLIPFKSLGIDVDHQSAPLGHEIKRLFKAAHTNGNHYFNEVLLSGSDPLDMVHLDLTLSIAMGDESSNIRYVDETRRKCPGKKIINTCKDDEAIKYKVRCTVQTVYTSANLDARSNTHSVFQRYKSASTKNKVCSDTNKSLPSKEQQLRKARKKLVAKLIGDYLPKTDKRPSDLAEPLNLMGEDLLVFDRIKALIGDNQLQEAESLLQGLIRKFPRDQEVLFDLAYVNQAMGNFQIADTYYKKITSPTLISSITKHKQENDKWLSLGYTSIGQP